MADLLCGNDFLKKSNAVLNFNKESLTLDGNSVPLRIWQDSSLQQVQLITRCRVKIPPQSMKWIPVRINGVTKESTLLFIEEDISDVHTNRPVVVPGLVKFNKAECGYEILAMNSSKRPIKAKANTKLSAIITQVESVQEISEMSTPTKPPDPNQYASLLQQIDCIDLVSDSDLTEQQQNQVREFLKQNVEVFAPNPKKPNVTTHVKHSINTGAHAPIQFRPHRSSHEEEKIIVKTINEFHELGLIRKSSSSWAFPVIIVPKKDNTVRFCVDYRPLNKITKKDTYPLPRIDDLLEKIQHKTFFSSFDMASGYYSVELEEDSKEKSAFVSKVGLYEWNVMPMGLCNSPKTYQRMMDEILLNLDWTSGANFIDDVAIGSDTFEVHFQDISKFFERIRKHGLQLKLAKCKLFKKRIVFLGHTISKDGVGPEAAKVEAVQKIRSPSNINEVRTFLGLTGYYRKFVQGYAQIAAPLIALLSKSNSFRWTSECEFAFLELKQQLMEKPILAFPNYDKPFYLLTDASTTGLGVILAQYDDFNKEHVIAYASRSLQKPEKKWTITELECLAVVYGVKCFRYYLHNRFFFVVTDHKALLWLNSMKDLSSRLGRWALKLQDFDYQIKHRAGKIHSNVDALSRSCGDTVHLMEEKDWSAEILKDSTYGPIAMYLKDGALPINRKDAEQVVRESSGFELVDNILCWKHVQHNPQKGTTIELRTVVPISKRDQVLIETHDLPFGGHLGVKRTFVKISANFYWRGMYQDVKNWVRVCEQCQRRKGAPDPKLGLPQHVTATRRFQIWGMDFIGPLPTTASGNKYLLVFTDIFSKWPEVVATKYSDAATVAKVVIEQIVPRYGVPEFLLSDRGKAFVGKLMEELNKLMVIQHTKTAPYHPQSNSVTERLNHTLVTMLSMFANSRQEDWDQYLPYVLFAYRTSVHESTGETPFKLVYGEDARIPTSLSDQLVQVDDEEGNLSDFKSRLMQTIKEVHAVARKRMERSKQIQEQYKMQTAKEHQFVQGDLVWLYCKQPGKHINKLELPWKGPFRIVTFQDETNAELQTLGSKKLKQIVHVSRLKKFSSTRPTEELQLADDDTFDFAKEEEEVKDIKAFKKEKKPPRPNSMATTESRDPTINELEVKDIVAVGTYYGQLRYKVAWKNLDGFETWEPVQNLTNCQQKVTEFHIRKGLWCPTCSTRFSNKGALHKHNAREHKERNSL